MNGTGVHGQTQNGSDGSGVLALDADTGAFRGFYRIAKLDALGFCWNRRSSFVALRPATMRCETRHENPLVLQNIQG